MIFVTLTVYEYEYVSLFLKIKQIIKDEIM